MLWIGLLSGTSADGVDAGLAEIGLAPGKAPRFLGARAHSCYPFPPDVRRRILELAEAPDLNAAELLRLDSLLGEFFAAAALDLCRSAGIKPEEVRAIGSHGQTIRHLPARREERFEFAGAQRHWRTASTLQVGDPAIIAERTGIATIGRFRHRDLAVGGQGAPLVPIFHLALLESQKARAAAVNIGGIANVTIPPAGGRPPLAFDTGPGNMVLDRLCSKFWPDGPGHDPGGAHAARGRIDEDLLREQMADPYFSKPPPKSTGREHFGKTYTEEFSRKAERLHLSPEDTLATAAALTAASIAEALQNHAGPLDRLFVCGGGARNAALLSLIRDRLPGTAVESTMALGMDPGAVESHAFAYLAACHEALWPGNIPSATGAGRAAVLGDRTPGRILP